MRPAQSVGQLAVALLSLTPVVSALAWPRWLPEVDAMIARRDDTTTSGPAPKQTSSPASPSPGDKTQAATTAAKTTTDDPNGHQLNTASIPKTTSGATKSGNQTSTETTSREEFNPGDPPGRASMVTPGLTDGSQLYKVGTTVTWGWNYTDLQGTPTALDILVGCRELTRTYTLTQNMTFETPATFTWDTGKTNEIERLVVNTYTLIIYDSDSSISAAPEPGYLMPFQGFTFGVYTPKPYVSFQDGWKCAACSAAMSETERRALGAAIGMSVVTVLSFTWFVTGFGVL
ncbi:hypothetical protein B0H63DRAFT_262859 [Podospora didyma]|uniref:DUF7137 domain-containing protein n=1 Tax=Podospora didyma TaxID=330526 RepID=A0AAE0KE19_9PEZI|nr:hypothetical protein B0H63DRAFT_262859 [Podospora didyma]